MSGTLPSAWTLFFASYAAVVAVGIAMRMVPAVLQAVVALLPFQFLTVEWGGVHVSPVEPSVALLVLAYALSGRWRMRKPVPESVARYLAAFLLCLGVSAIAGGDWIASGKALVRLGIALSVFLICIWEGVTLQQALRPLGVSTAALAVLLAIDSVELIPWTAGALAAERRGGENLGGSNALAVMIAMVLALGLPSLWRLRGRVLAMGLAHRTLLFGGVLAAASRQALLGLGLAAGVGLVQGRRARLTFLALLALLCVTLAMGRRTLGIVGRLRQLTLMSDEGEWLDPSLGQRVRTLTAAVEMVRDYPLLGVGPGGFPEAYVEYADEAHLRYSQISGTPEVRLRSPHNLLLFVASEAGLPALAAYLAFLGALAWPALTRARQGAEDAVAVSLALLAMAVSSLVNDMHLLAGTTWCLLALTCVAATGRVRPCGQAAGGAK